MTYQEYYNKLQEEFAKRSDKFIKAEKNLSEANGFADINLLSDFSEAKRRFDEAANKYHEFLNYVKEHGIDPNDEIS